MNKEKHPYMSHYTLKDKLKIEIFVTTPILLIINFSIFKRYLSDHEQVERFFFIDFGQRL